MTSTLEHGGQSIAYEDHGAGPLIAALHGLTATRRYVLMGSHTLERSGRRVLLYDARGHGASAPAAGGDYSYAAQVGDLAALLEASGAPDAVLIGASMGAHTALRFALEAPARVRGLVVVTPGYDPDRSEVDMREWDALARGCGRAASRASSPPTGSSAAGRLAADGGDCDSPAHGRTRAPTRGLRRARGGAALAAVRELVGAGLDLRPDRRRRKSR